MIENEQTLGYSPSWDEQTKAMPVPCPMEVTALLQRAWDHLKVPQVLRDKVLKGFRPPDEWRSFLLVVYDVLVKVNCADSQLLTDMESLLSSIRASVA